MSVNIVQTTKFLTLLGGSSTQISHLKQSLSRAPILVCADGGADRALEAGLMPDAVIGDMDSISPKTRAQIAPDRLHEVADQDNTDFDKCLTHIDAPLILAEGFAGGRLDHQLAAFTTLAAFPDQKVVLMSEHDACFLAPEALDLALPEGTRLSLFPMGPLTGEGEGLEYPIDGLDFAPAGRIGTSNMVTGPVRLRFDARHMLVIVPRAQVDPVIAALAPGLGF